MAVQPQRQVFLGSQYLQDALLVIERNPELGNHIADPVILAHLHTPGNRHADLGTTVPAHDATVLQQ